ncbi:MAG: hypothetical protein SGPRY_009582 [Prymnesium sp.]
MELPSDAQAALAYLRAQCPPSFRARGLVVVWCSQLYALLADRTSLDREIELARLAHELRVLQLPSAREEQVIVDAAEYERAMAADADSSTLSAPERAAMKRACTALAACTGIRVRREELHAALGGEAEAEGVARVLKARGWITPPPQTAPIDGQEAPALQDSEWNWALPDIGRLTRELYPLCTEVLRVLHRQRFGRALRVTVERHHQISKLLRNSRIDLSFVLRDMVSVQQQPGGDVVESPDFNSRDSPSKQT